MIKTRRIARYLVLPTVLLLLLGSPAGAIHRTLNPRALDWAKGSSAGQSGDCTVPSLDWDGQPPTSVAGPFLGAPIPNVVHFGSAGAGSLGSTCKWKLSFEVKKHDPTVYVTTMPGLPLQINVTNEFNSGGTDGVRCAAYYRLENGYGGAAAQESLASTLCNTDGFTNGEGSVSIDDANLQAGPTTIVAPTQQYWYQSFVEGANALVGNFAFCSQDPEGQHSTYACIEFQAGPYE